MSDVYSGDDGLASGIAPATDCERFAYRITGYSDPDMLLRIASQLLLSNRLPNKLLMVQETSDTVLIEIEVDGISASIAESIRRKLQQLNCVDSIQLMRSARR